MDQLTEPGCPLDASFVAVNFITCRPEYVRRFTQLFASRAKAIDRMPGFCGMQVLEPLKTIGRAKGDPDGASEAYLIVSYWRNGDDFHKWMGSEEFLEGHKRGFEDIRHAKERGEEPPVRSEFHTYKVLAR